MLAAEAEAAAECRSLEQRLTSMIEAQRLREADLAASGEEMQREGCSIRRHVKQDVEKKKDGHQQQHPRIDAEQQVSAEGQLGTLVW